MDIRTVVALELAKEVARLSDYTYINREELMQLLAPALKKALDGKSVVEDIVDELRAAALKNLEDGVAKTVSQTVLASVIPHLINVIMID